MTLFCSMVDLGSATNLLAASTARMVQRQQEAAERQQEAAGGSSERRVFLAHARQQHFSASAERWFGNAAEYLSNLQSTHFTCKRTREHDGC